MATAAADFAVEAVGPIEENLARSCQNNRRST